MAFSSVLISRVDFRRLLRVLDLAADKLDEAVLDLLDRKLEHGRVLEPREVPRDIITMNSRFSYRRLTGGTTKVATLVYPEAAPEVHGISVLSPLGALLLGAREGEILDWGRALPIHHIRLERLNYQPEAAGHWHR